MKVASPRVVGHVLKRLNERFFSRGAWASRSVNQLKLLVSLISIGAMANAFAASPQSWTTNVVAGDFPSESSALSAVRSQGAEYAYAEELQYAYQDSLTTRYVYKAKPRQPDVGTWLYTGYGIEAPGIGSEEQAKEGLNKAV
jgi:hypothetical protein